MADWQRRRHPRSDFVAQPALSPAVTAQLAQRAAALVTWAPRPPRRPQLYPSTTFQDGGWIWWIVTNPPPPFDVRTQAIPASAAPFWPRTQYRKGRRPVRIGGGGVPPAPPLDPALFQGTAAFFPPTPKRLQRIERGDIEDVAIALRPAVDMPALEQFSSRPPLRLRPFPSSPAQDGAWIWWTQSQQVAAGFGGGYSPTVSRWQVHFQDIAQPVFGGPSSTATPVIDVAPLTTLHLPGPVLQYDDFAQPLIAPPNVIIPPPEGVAAFLTTSPPPYRLRLLPEMGTTLAFQPFPTVGGSALSWVPVYEGRAGLPPSLHPSGPPAQFATIIIPPPPASAATYAAIYPDRVGREPGRGYPNYGPSITWTPITITPPAPPTQHKHVDLRRRELLLIRRLIS